MLTTEVEFREPEEAFDDAIIEGRLSILRCDTNYAGYYMYMGTWDGKDQFKHVHTRKYIK